MKGTAFVFMFMCKQVLKPSTHDQIIIQKISLSKRSYNKLIINMQLSRAYKDNSYEIIQWEKHKKYSRTLLDHKIFI